MNNIHIKQILTLVALFVIPFLLTGCSLRKNNKQTPNAEQQTLTIWRHKSVTDAEEKAFQTILDTYESESGINVIYRAFKPTEDYEKAVINSLAAGTGPDIWEIRNDELPRHKAKLQPLDLSPEALEYYQKNFYSTLTQEMIADSKLYGFPLAIDPLVLYYNEDHFNEAETRQAPTTWKETIELANKLTVKSNNVIVRPGLALGTASNVDRASDIMQLLMHQFNTQMVDSAKKTATFDLYVQDPETKEYKYPGKTAVALYQSFSHADSPYRSWSLDQAYTTQMFAQGNLSMMINYLSLSPQIKSLSPDLKFSVATTPQWVTKKIPVGDLPAEISDPVHLAKYNAFVVSKPSLRLTKEEQDARVALAWQFIGYIGKSEISQPYLETTSTLSPRLGDAESFSNDGESNDVIKKHLVSWHKGPSPRAVDQLIFRMVQEITEKGQSLDQTMTQAAQAISRLLQ